MPYKDPHVARQKSAERMRRAYHAHKGYAESSDARKRQRRWIDPETGVRRKPVFVAIDGEGTNQDDGSQWYTLLAARTVSGNLGDAMTDRKSASIEDYRTGLPTEHCLQFLLDISWRGDQTYVAYFFNYDVCKILHDLSDETLLALWRGGWVVWNGRRDSYYIKWIPSKFLTIAEYRPTPGRPFNPRRDLGRQVTIYDVSGFFQCSFVKALTDWKLADNEQVGEIATMKGKRNDFTERERTRIRRYCLDECRYLCLLMNALASALWDAGIYLGEWHGAGAIAKALFAANNVKDHFGPEIEPDSDLERAILGAYFGGRIELFQQGYFEGGVYDYDLQSAYPSAAIDLPSLKGAVWTHITSPTMAEVNSFTGGLLLLSWDVTEKLARSRSNRQAPLPIGPLPFRYQGRITFPLQAGPTWVHLEEARTAMDIFGPTKFTLHEAWLFTSAENARPFAFLADIARERIRAKQAGEMKHIPLKLGMNSVYGKLAQGQRDPHKMPEYLSYYYAGAITARTRATILRAAVAAGPDLVAIATDGVFTTRCLDDNLDFGDVPGTWERATTPDDAMLFLQPGVMFSRRGQIKKTRGFARSTLSYEDSEVTYHDGLPFPDGLCPPGTPADESRRVERRWRAAGRAAGVVTIPGLASLWLQNGNRGRVGYTERRFVGIGGGVGSGRADLTGRWIEQRRWLSFFIGGHKFYHANEYSQPLDGDDDSYELGAEWEGANRHIRRLIPADFSGTSSEPYIKPHLVDERGSYELLALLRAGDERELIRSEQPDWMDYVDVEEML